MRRAELIERLAFTSPITYDMALQVYGATPNLNDDKERACFFAVWALLVREWAEAVTEELRPAAARGGNPPRAAIKE